MSAPAIRATAVESLSPEESARFAELTEQAKRDLGVVRSALPAYNRLNDTLAEIRNRQLYRADFDTFDDYCRTELGISPSYASRKILHGEVFRDLESLPIGTTDAPRILPIGHESQTRPLNALTSDQRRAAWTEAAHDAGGKQPTAKQVKAAADRVTGKAPAEPTDVSRARAAGIIPEGASVTIDEPDAGDDDTTEGPVPTADLSDGDWLASLPAREQLTTLVRERFDREALLYRALTPFREEYRRKCRPFTEKAKTDGRGHIGPYLGRHLSHFKTKDPRDWVACVECRDAAGKATGQLSLVGPCPACHGEAYHVNAD